MHGLRPVGHQGRRPGPPRRGPPRRLGDRGRTTALGPLIRPGRRGAGEGYGRHVRGAPGGADTPVGPGRPPLVRRGRRRTTVRAWTSAPVPGRPCARRSPRTRTAGPDFARPSGCAGRLVRDLVCHPVIDAQDVLITLATPAATEPTVDAVTYRPAPDRPPTGRDPLDALTVRPPRTRIRPCSGSTSTTSAPPRAARPNSPIHRPGWGPRARSSPRPTTRARTSWSGRCATSIRSRTSRTYGPCRPRRARPAPAPCSSGPPGRRSPRRSPTGTRTWSAPAAARPPTRSGPNRATRRRGSPSSWADPPTPPAHPLLVPLTI
ncbi:MULTISPECIES: maleylpyruvate isomerase N-terminal domain-containing protein [unclassified Streptomyces]|uniref:maleylpyruvate isomerase N-terminal domain-containing protein n=1 Tax=unclassified Streptomyces TaxID=2593676 RepID=UPI003B63631D